MFYRVKIMNEKIGKSLVWKLLERFGVQGVQFILQLVLARILDPSHYGMLSIMIVFVNLANVFVQNGFNTALIQNKDVTEEDYSSVFWVSLTVAGALYAAIFLGAPFIASYYEMPEIISPLRVIALVLFPGALNSVQVAKVSREMDFKKIFYSNVAGVLISGAAGVAIAYMGGGLWALVAQTLINYVVTCIVMRFTVRLKLDLVCRMSRVRTLFSFGWKLLVSALIETLYQDLRGLVIGKKYDSSMLGYYNRGKQFPQFINNAVNGAVQSVMLPAMSEKQNDKSQVKTMMRESITLSAYIMFPVMAGLAAVASPLVSVLIGDKWLPCVPFLQIYCFSFAFYPVHACNLQAINAMGRSDIFLRLEIIKKVYGLIALVIAVVYFDSPVAIAMTGLITTGISFFVNAYPNKKLIGYSYIEQLKDILPFLIVTAAMYGVTALAGLPEMNNLVTLVVQVLAGMVFYVTASRFFLRTQFDKLWGAVRGLVHKG